MITVKKTMTMLAVVFMLGISCASAQTTNLGEGSKNEKPSTERPSLGSQTRGWADNHGISAGKSTTGGGGKICKDVIRDVKVCLEKDGYKINSGWSGTVGTTWK